MWIKNIKTNNKWFVSEEHGKKLLKNEDYEEVEIKKSNSNGPTVPELKKLAAEKGIEGYETMKKDELIAALKQVTDNEQSQ